MQVFYKSLLPVFFLMLAFKGPKHVADNNNNNNNNNNNMQWQSMQTYCH
jgi:hypothetical protein